MEQRELTFGEKAVGLTFNPSNDPKVQEVKELYAKIIDLLHEGSAVLDADKARLFEIAIYETQSAQMWSVKAITWK